MIDIKPAETSTDNSKVPAPVTHLQTHSTAHVDDDGTPEVKVVSDSKEPGSTIENVKNTEGEVYEVTGDNQLLDTQGNVV